MSVRVLLVDDQPLLRVGFRMVLTAQQDITVVGEAGGGAEAVQLTAELDPDVVLMAVRMPGVDGVETTRRIKKISPRTQVVVLTSYHEDAQIFPALKAGAISYILKDMKMEKLVEALHRAVQGEVT
ncbi:MAG: response regulator, partial [Mycobacteriaceae bacterium]